MSRFIDLETEAGLCTKAGAFDLIVVGGGPAGLTIAREMSGRNIRIAVLESGAREETPDHEALNIVDVSGTLNDQDIQRARSHQHQHQLKVWSAETQKFGVRCRVLGGSTAAWAGKVAPFQAIDFERRPWIANSGWPICTEELAPYLDRAAAHLDLGPIVQGDDFWPAANQAPPPEIAALRDFDAFFWQFARSRHALTDVMRFGPDFQHETHSGVTVFLNATASSVVIANGVVEGVKIVSSLSGHNIITLPAPRVVLAAGAIENPRLLLLSPGADHGPVGCYLTDHPSVSLGHFDDGHKDHAAQILGFYVIRQGYRSFIYACGLALRPDLQRECRMPNMAAFMTVSIAADDPLNALMRLAKRKSRAPLKDIFLVLRNAGVVSSAVGKKLINYRRIPERLRRLIADTVVFLSANTVVREYIGGGRGRRLDRVGLSIIAEQPPEASNRITLSEQTDHLGLRRAHVQWELPSSLRRDIVSFGEKLIDDLKQAGINGFVPEAAVARRTGSSLIIHDMAHTAGTTRMGLDRGTSVVDTQLQVHGVQGLFVAGASVFPTSGHANPTLVIMALAIRLADRLRHEMIEEKINKSLKPNQYIQQKPLVVVTGATGNLGQALVSNLIEAGYRVRGQFRNKVPIDTRVEWVRRDFADPTLLGSDLDSLVQGAEAVINLAASTVNVAEMPTANVTSLDLLAQACVRCGVRYFGQASSMVVYGSPTRRFVDENAPLIDLNRPIRKQYFAQAYMQEMAKSKIQGEKILEIYKNYCNIDIYRIAVSPDKEFRNDPLKWSRLRQLACLYRNSHFIEPQEVARAIVHLMTIGLRQGANNLEIYNIANSESPTFAQIYQSAGRKAVVHIPLIFDIIKNIAISKKLSVRLPMGAFRLDDRKLRATGFLHKA